MKKNFLFFVIACFVLENNYLFGDRGNVIGRFFDNSKELAIQLGNLFKIALPKISKSSDEIETLIKEKKNLVVDKDELKKKLSNICSDYNELKKEKNILINIGNMCKSKSNASDTIRENQKGKEIEELFNVSFKSQKNAKEICLKIEDIIKTVKDECNKVFEKTYVYIDNLNKKSSLTLNCDQTYLDEDGKDRPL